MIDYPCRITEKESKHMELNTDPAFKPFSEETLKTFSFWDRVWLQNPPRLHYQDATSWKDEKKFKQSAKTVNSKTEL